MSLKDSTEKLGYNEEDRIFHERDAAWLAAKRKQLDDARQARAADATKAAHFMKCPKCGSDLEEIDFHGVKVDRCKGCAGLWFDQGEFEILTAAKPKGFLQRFLGS